jgi:hypothetical protein
VHHTVSSNIALFFLESGHIQVLLSKNRFLGSREFCEGHLLMSCAQVSEYDIPAMGVYKQYERYNFRD